MSYKFPLAFDSWNNDEKQAIFNVVESGFLTMGDKVKEFEQSFELATQKPHMPK